MSKKQWMVLLMLFLTYLLLGASIFYHIESKVEIETVQKARKERIEINKLLQDHYIPQTKKDQNEILKKLTSYCGKSVYSYGENETDPLKWDFYNSFYFAYTVVSTIGYGNLAPTNMLSRILMMFYAVVGIPMNGILLAQLGDFFSIVFIRAHEKYKSYKKNHYNNSSNNNNNECKKKRSNLETRKAGLAVQILMYLIPGFAMFIFFPAFVFSHYEGWSYDEAVYYAFVTLTTIGFGDYVAGQDNAKGSGILFIFYKSFLIAWISFGLGYIVMIMTFITRGMRSKKIVRLEHKLAVNLKQTQSKIWSEFNKEVNYLRRVFNELQLSKVKRIYVDEYDDETPRTKLMRSNSFPDLRKLVYGGLPSSAPTHPRRRANSEVMPIETTVARVVSETDLQRIDKTATFATHAIVQPAELLARLVNVLGYIPPPIEDDEPPEIDGRGVEGFSDKEILSNEYPSGWKLGGDKIPFGKPRSRAASEVQLDSSFEPNIQRNQEWTWSGPAASRKIQELIKARRNANVNKESKSKFGGLNLSKSVPLPRWIKHLSTKKDDQQTRNSVSAGDLDSTDDSYLSNVTGQTYFTHTGAANLSSTLEGNNLLEETSLADFLRALTALHARVGAVPDEFVKKPQRKMGTACLTPPKLPNLFTLFSPPEVPQSTQSTITSTGRKFSLKTAENSNCSTPTYDRRSSAIQPAVNKPKGRRFSLRPVTTPTPSPFLPGTFRKDSPPYNANSFAFECPKEPLVSMEGAPGVSSPVAITSESRRLSLRPFQQSNFTSPVSAPTSKGMPKWKAGMLQRQINQLNLQRRVRAFSLGDVNDDDSKTADRNVQISPLALEPDVNMLNVASKDLKNSNQKTVTIVSPSLDERKQSILDQKKIYQRYNPFVESINPFIVDLENQGEEYTDKYTENVKKPELRTMFQVIREVKNVKTVPTSTQELAACSTKSTTESVDENKSDQEL